jgi:uncharacterized membrane protein YdjX (TVP38/TMEM64 family)
MNLVRKLSVSFTQWIDQQQKSRRFWLVSVLLVTVLGLLLYYGPTLWELVQDEAKLQAFVAWLGWFGPVALICLNVLQIVIAPIPGYVVQAVSGLLFGPFWGGLWGAIGLLLGAMLAMWLARTFGRFWVERLLGPDRLDQWLLRVRGDNTGLWLLLLAVPTGDLPYFLAGLATVNYVKIFLLTLVIRVPATFVVAAMGAGVVGLSGWQLALLGGLLAGLLALFLRYQTPLMAWIDQRLQSYIAKTSARSQPVNSSNEQTSSQDHVLPKV